MPAVVNESKNEIGKEKFARMDLHLYECHELQLRLISLLQNNSLNRSNEN